MSVQLSLMLLITQSVMLSSSLRTSSRENSLPLIVLKRSPPLIIPMFIRLFGLRGNGIRNIEFIISLATMIVLLPLSLSMGSHNNRRARPLCRSGCGSE
jgi:hypothetical protein